MTEIHFDSCQHCGKNMAGLPSRRRRKYCSFDCVQDARRAAGPARFWARVDKSGAGCWLYMGFRKWDGYGWVARSRGHGDYRWMTAHRYAWMLTNGEPPEGMHLLHTCDNPPCCNPAHLRLGTHDENMAEMKAKGRWNSGHTKKYKPVLHPDRVRPKRAA